MIKTNKPIIERDEKMDIKKFELKLKKLKNKEIESRLLELFKTDEKAALNMFDVELAKRIIKDNENLFKRLSKL